MKKLGLFAAGVLFGTAGIKLLGSKDAKKVYAHTTAAALRAKEGVMKTVTAVREGAEDVYADAKAINERRAEAEAAAVVDAPITLGGFNVQPVNQRGGDVRRRLAQNQIFYVHTSPSFGKVCNHCTLFPGCFHALWRITMPSSSHVASWKL